MSHERITVIYEPDAALRKGYGALFGEIFAELTQNRWLIWQLFKRDCFALYKQSFIGVFWAFLVPLISVATFVLLNRSGVFNMGAVDIPYPVFAVAGLALWQLFSAGLIANSGALAKAGVMVAKINFSKKSLVIASAGTSIISFVLQLVLLLLLCGVYHIWPGWGVFLFPIFAIPIVLFTLGLGLVLSVLNGIMRDVGNALSVMMTFLMFLTPVLYVKPEGGLLAELSRYNPMYYLTSVPREWIFFGHSSEWLGYAVSCVVSLLVFGVCLVVFHLTETRVAERV